MQRIRYILPLLCALLCGCKDTTFVSSVPSYPVSLRIDTRTGVYVNFVPTNIYTYLIVDKDGYHFNGLTYPRKELGDAYGYAGVVVYIAGDGQYYAFDLCCPGCINRAKPIEMDGMFGTCPLCGEVYDLGNGLGVPTKGVVREALRRYTTIVSDGGVVTVRN